MFGRRSYEAFAPVWPDSEDHAAYKELPKFVVSSSLSDDALVEGWGPTTILRSTEDVAALKQGDGGADLHPRQRRSWPAACRTPTSSTATTCSCSRSCWERARACSAEPIGTSSSCRSGSRATYSNGVAKLIYDVKR